MHTFVDTAGHTWTVAITVDTIKRVRALVGFDLLAVVEKDTLQKLIDDPITLCDVMYAVIKPEADTNEISDVQFWQSLSGDVLDTASAALLQELTDFFPKAKRTVLQKVLSKMETATRFATEKAMTRLDAIDLEKAVNQLFDQQPQVSGETSGNVRGPSVATPAP